jgi:hypothetical protein
MQLLGVQEAIGEICVNIEAIEQGELIYASAWQSDKQDRSALKYVKTKFIDELQFCEMHGERACVVSRNAKAKSQAILICFSMMRNFWLFCQAGMQHTIWIFDTRCTQIHMTQLLPL